MRDLLDADYGSEKYKEFIFPERYVIPSSCFDLEKKDDDRVLWQFLALNIEFVKQADPSQCHPLLYQASLQRLWNAFVQDKKCPQWIKDKSDKLCAKILALPTSILILFDGLDERIKQCDRTNPNGFQELLITLVTEILLTLSKSPDISTKEDMAKLLSGLIDIFEKEKTFHAKLCYVIINRAHTIIKNMKPEDVASSDAIEIACNDSDSLKEILLFVKEMVGSVTQNYSGITKDEKINLFKMLESLEGSVPKKYFAETMPQLIHEVILTYAKENKDEKLVTMVEKFLPDTVGFIEEDLKGIAKKINEIKNISIRQAMLIILTSRISTVEKLNCIGAVAKGKCERTSNVRKTATRRLYKELVHFYNVDENNFRKSLEEFKRPVSPTIVTGFSFFSSRTNSPETTPSTSPSDSPLFTSIKEFRA